MSIRPGGLLAPIFEISQIVQSEGVDWEEARRRWEEAQPKEEPPSNVVYGWDFVGKSKSQDR